MDSSEGGAASSGETSASILERTDSSGHRLFLPCLGTIGASAEEAAAENSTEEILPEPSSWTNVAVRAGHQIRQCTLFPKP